MNLCIRRLPRNGRGALRANEIEGEYRHRRKKVYDRQEHRKSMLISIYLTTTTKVTLWDHLEFCSAETVHKVRGLKRTRKFFERT